MPLQIDTLTTINGRVQSDINGNVKGADSRLRRSVLGAIAFILSGLSWAWYQFLAYVARQRLPDTMDDDQLPRFGGLFGVPPKGSAIAAGTATATGVENSPILAGTALQTQNQVVYITTADAKIVGGSATLSVVAAVAGSAGNQAAGVVLNFIAPVAGVNMNATVVLISGGLDVEDIDYYRGRVINHLQEPPQGGNVNDYEAWAQSQPGVTRAWCLPNYIGAGTIGVFFVFDDRDNIIPTAADVTAMQAFLETKAPSTDTVYAVAPVPNPMPLTIKLNPNNATVQGAVTTELQDLINREAAPGGTIHVSHIRDAVGLGAGDGDWKLPSPLVDFTNTTVQIATLGPITWAAWP